MCTPTAFRRSGPSLQDLPPELFLEIMKYLGYNDMKCVRLLCHYPNDIFKNHARHWPLGPPPALRSMNAFHTQARGARGNRSRGICKVGRATRRRVDDVKDMLRWMLPEGKQPLADNLCCKCQKIKPCPELLPRQTLAGIKPPRWVGPGVFNDEKTWPTDFRRIPAPRDAVPSCVNESCLKRGACRVTCTYGWSSGRRRQRNDAKLLQICFECALTSCGNTMYLGLRGDLHVGRRLHILCAACKQFRPRTEERRRPKVPQELLLHHKLGRLCNKCVLAYERRTHNSSAL